MWYYHWCCIKLYNHWCDVVQCDVERCDVVWRDVVWRSVTWCDVVWRGVTWSGVMCWDVTWWDMMWCNVTWCDVKWCDVLRRDVMWCAVMWCSFFWCELKKIAMWLDVNAMWSSREGNAIDIWSYVLWCHEWHKMIYDVTRYLIIWYRIPGIIWRFSICFDFIRNHHFEYI